MVVAGCEGADADAAARSVVHDGISGRVPASNREHGEHGEHREHGVRELPPGPETSVAPRGSEARTAGAAVKSKRGGSGASSGDPRSRGGPSPVKSECGAGGHGGVDPASWTARECPGGSISVPLITTRNVPRHIPGEPYPGSRRRALPSCREPSLRRSTRCPHPRPPRSATGPAPGRRRRSVRWR